MRNITYKYNIGDVVALKPDHYFEADVMGQKVLITAAEIVGRKDYNGPCYNLGGSGCFWKEACFAGLAATEPQNRLYSYEGAEVYTNTPEVFSCDTESSGESEKETKTNIELVTEALGELSGVLDYIASERGTDDSLYVVLSGVETKIETVVSRYVRKVVQQ